MKICFSLNMLLIINSIWTIRVENIDRSVGQQGLLLPRSFLHTVGKLGLSFLGDVDSFAELTSVIAVDAEFCKVGHHVRVDGEVWIEHLGL